MNKIIEVTPQLYIGPSPNNIFGIDEKISSMDFDNTICVAEDKATLDDSIHFQLTNSYSDGTKEIFLQACQKISELLNEDKKIYVYSWDGLTRCAIVVAFVLSNNHSEIEYWLNKLITMSNGQVCDSGGWFNFVNSILSNTHKKTEDVGDNSELISHKNIEFYSAIPYGGSNNNPDEWFHVKYNSTDKHMDAMWNIENLFRPDVDDSEKPFQLNSIKDHFENIRLHYALDYTSWKYHENLILWCKSALIMNGNLQIITRNPDHILQHWINNALGDKSSISNWYQKLLGRVGISSNQFAVLEREEIYKAVPDKINLDREKMDWEFDLWLNQMLYSSGSGEPQDVFKSLCSITYLSDLIRNSGLIIKSIDVNKDNTQQIILYAFKHPSRYFGDN